MVRHKCRKLECPPDNVKGPKVNCLKCNTCCYLQCFGYEKGPSIENNETVKKDVDGHVEVMFVSCLAFVCCDTAATSDEIRKKLKLPKARETSRATSPTNDEATSEIKAIKEMIVSIKNSTDANTAAIAEIKSTTAKTEANVQKVSDQNDTLKQMQLNATPSSGTGQAMAYVNRFRYRAAVKAQTPKRSRSDSPEPNR